jgi:hypothetical protein
MKKYPIMIIIALLFLAFVASCQKNSLNSVPTDYFPNRVGDEWIYEVTDSAPEGNYPAEHSTVKISITGITKLLDGQNATIWQYQYPSGSLINYFRMTVDTMKMFTLYDGTTIEALYYPQMIYILPFTLNETWRGNLANFDSSRVFGQVNVKRPLQQFQNCFEIFHYYVGPEIYHIDTLWFKPYIGFVQMRYVHMDAGPTINSYWQLKSFFSR